MRKLVLEFTEEGLGLFQNSPLSSIQSNEIIHLLRYDGKEFAAIMKIQFKDPSTKIEEIFPYAPLNNVKIELLEQEGNASIYFVKGTLASDAYEHKLLSTGGYFLTPLEINNGKIKMTLLGKPKQLKSLLKTIDESGLKYKVVSLSEATFSPNAPLSCLTQKQRSVLVTSFKEGYYDMPRRTSSQDLAKILGLKSSALIEHRRKAERRLISSILNES
jgi:predicted DNA binding protein